MSAPTLPRVLNAPARGWEDSRYAYDAQDDDFPMAAGEFRAIIPRVPRGWRAPCPTCWQVPAVNGACDCA